MGGGGSRESAEAVRGVQGSRALPAHPPALHRRVFAPNHIVAKSASGTVSQRKKMKKSSGEIIGWRQVFKKSIFLRVKNFGIWLRLDPRSGTCNTTGSTGIRPWQVPSSSALCPHPLKPDHEGGGTRFQPASATHRQSSSSTTSRLSSRCLTRSSGACTSHAPPSRGQTPSF